jgi:murein DD-endopeptidase MepM/ murein hydrolase activator NlpD
MKFKIKEYHNRFSLKFSEKFFVIRKKFEKSWERFVDKGHEKMTIMFIPHNEKNIFNFQISKFTISFFCVLFLVIIVTSSYAVIRNNAIKKEEQRLLTTYQGIRSHLLRFEKITNNVDDLVRDIKPEIETLYELATGTDQSNEKIWENSDFDKEGFTTLLKMKNILPREIFTIKDLQRDLLSTTKTIKTIKNFINIRSKVIKDTPSIVPNRGHITSLFGWRRSPFGHGRDFHTGIDIAAAGGTPIRATAPGYIVRTGWAGGYGRMVKVKHEYGFETVYAHCQTIAVSPKKYVYKGQVIGYVGMSGNSTGYHCHYEVRLGGIPINPYPYMSGLW